MSRACVLLRIDPERVGVRDDLALSNSLRMHAGMTIGQARAAVPFLRLGGVVAVKDAEVERLVTRGFSIIIEFGK